MRTTTSAIAALALAGCSHMSQPFIPLAATPSTFAAELYGPIFPDPMGGMSARYQLTVEAADRHCASVGKTARLTQETPVGGARRRLTFGCV